MASDITRLSALSSLSTMIGMAIDPLESMRKLGIGVPSATLLKMGLSSQTSRKTLYLTGGENVRPVFTNTDIFHTSNPPMRYPGGGAPARLRRGLIGNQGAEHKHYRSSFLKVTGHEMMVEFSLNVARYVEDYLKGFPDDKPIDLVAMVTELIRYYAVVTMYKDEDPQTSLQVGRQVTDWIELSYNPGNILLPFDLPGLPHARYRREAVLLEQNLLKWADLRRGMDARRDLLSMFVNGPDENGNPLPDDRLAGHIMTLYASSFTSSVASLIWSIFLLMQHPDIANDLCDELDGSGIDPLSDGMKLLELPLLDNALKESMRLFTPVPYQVRRVAEATQLNGTDLKQNDRILIGSWATNRLASTYANAANYRPERWFELDSGSYDYLTFSAGPRRCVGYNLALIMVKISLATIMLKRRPRLIPDTRIDMNVAITMRSKKPIPVILAKRSANFERASVSGSVTGLYAL